MIDDEGKQIGVMKTDDALAFAQERELDLVEVAPDARPPVARVLDYSKYKYEQAQKLKQARKHQQQITIMFRGREVTHPERGTAILDRLAEELSELGVIEQRPMQEGRNMTMMMAPSKAVLAGRVGTAAAVAPSPGEPSHDGDVASAALESSATAAPAGAPEPAAGDRAANGTGTGPSTAASTAVP